MKDALKKGIAKYVIAITCCTKSGIAFDKICYQIHK